MNKTAIVLGATGLVGSHLVSQLVENSKYQQIILLVRRATLLQSNKITEHIIDFDVPESWAHLVKGDVLFSAFGTTIKKAGSKEKQFQIDYTYQLDAAIAARKNGVSACVLVSSAGANTKSMVFYSRMKGQLDEAVTQLGFDTLVVLKPSVLVGQRNEKRFGESMGIVLGNILTSLPGLKNYKPIYAGDVAKAMVHAAELDGNHSFALNKVFDLAQKKEELPEK